MRLISIHRVGFISLGLISLDAYLSYIKNIVYIVV